MSYTEGVPVVYFPLTIVNLAGMIKDGVEELQRFKHGKNEKKPKFQKDMKKKADFEMCLWKNIHKADLLLEFRV